MQSLSERLSETSTLKLHTGRAMPVLGLDTWQLDDQTGRAVARALERGYRMIDTSGDYGTQPGIARALEEMAIERASLYLVTKVEETDDACAATKKNLRRRC